MQLLLGNNSVTLSCGNEYTRNDRRTVARGIFYAVRPEANFQFSVKGK
jgi:hypothetical protein